MSSLSQNQSVLSNAVDLKISSSVITVTPKLAQKWLDGMIKNQRPANAESVSKYARAMKNGVWRLAAPLSFDLTNQLIDGQHRLLAVIKANIAVDFIVLQGLATEAIEAIDMGTGRTAAHLGRLQGLELTTRHLAILNVCFTNIESLTRPPTLSKQEQVVVARAHFESLDFAAKRMSAGSVGSSCFVAPVARAYYHENHQRLDEFLQVLHSGFSVSPNPNDDTAAIALRNLYFKDRQNTNKVDAGSIKRMVDYKKATFALKSFILRKPIKILKEQLVNIHPVSDFDAWWKA